MEKMWFLIACKLYLFKAFLFQQKLMLIEQKKEGKMMSSIESIDFSVTSKEDVEITIKDVAGWHLDKGAPMVLPS